MTYKESLEFIHSNFWQGSKPGLSRTRELLEKIGNPQDKLRFVHVAGTNGKGSFCAMLSSVLKEEGYRVGTYTSPYVLRFNERMKINGLDIPDGTLAELTEFIRPFADSMEEKPTEFELITAIAMEYFAREKCDIVVLECGMGGRLDSTNIIKTPVLSVITGVSLDHTSYLGNTVSEIAQEKAGIIKSGVTTLFCSNDVEALTVIKETAEKLNAPFYTVSRGDFETQKSDLTGTVFSYKEFKNIELGLLGNYQPENAQNVLTAIELLRDLGFDISDDSVKRGLKNVRWPARFEMVSENPVIICDGGHNPQGIDAAVESTMMYFGDKKLVIVTGMMADKNYQSMVACLAQITSEAFCISPDNPRALPADRLAQEFCQFGVEATACPSAADALSKAVISAKAGDSAVFCVGSLYMYKDIINAIKEIKI